MRFRGSCDMISLQLTYEAPVFLPTPRAPHFFLLQLHLRDDVAAVYKYRKLSSPAVYTYRKL